MFVHYILVWDYFLNVEGVVLGPGGRILPLGGAK